MLTVSSDWISAYPGAMMGILAMQDVTNPDHAPALEREKAALEEKLRARYAGMNREDILAGSILQAYRTYYKRFTKTYHVLLQLESVIFKEKPVASASTLVEALFIAELDTLLLTAIHDLDRIEEPLLLDIATGEEEYILLRGESHRCAAGDMIMRDRQGVICSVIYGSDLRTRIGRDTKSALFAVYIPPGVPPEAVEDHLDLLQRNVRLIAPASTISFREVYGTR
jgi:DNA/RNA-binding domain of Phe-tRNA-synthetase-like protein